MFEFVIVDDNINYQGKVKGIINEICVKRNVDYNVKQYSTITQKLKNEIGSKTRKIYVIAIGLAKDESGIDLIRMIRTKDLKSVVIVLTSHERLAPNILRSGALALDFISKYDECDKKLKLALKRAVSIVDDAKIISFRSYGVLYRIYVNDIITIERDGGSQRTIIKTIYNKISIRNSILSIYEKLPKNFYQTHRSCIINLDKVLSFDKKKNILRFVDDSTTDLISRRFRAGLIEYIENK